MKITLISFDFWHYDEHIVNCLNKNGAEAHHINIGAYQHKNSWARIVNAFSKVVLRKNLKTKNREDFILQRLQQLGLQDQILVINPESIDLACHQKIKKYTKSYKAYLYDSVKRCPVEHLLQASLFDYVYSFDKEDCLQYGFLETTNYNYLKKKSPIKTTALDLIYIGSIDERLSFLQELAERCKENALKFQFFAIGKKATLAKIKQVLLGKLPLIHFRRKRFSPLQTLEMYRKSNVIVDVIRENQTGLSFRVFESMALGKKIISTNQNLLQYNIAESSNVLVLKKDWSNFDPMFFTQNAVEYNQEIYEQYTINTWVQNVFFN